MDALVIDDSETTRIQLEMCLQHLYKANVTQAVNGQDALDILREGQAFDIIFCDINMPIMGGFQFLETMHKEDLCKAPIVIVSTEGGGFMKEQGKHLGAKAWLLKPFEQDQVEKIANRLLKIAS
ncbi:response regulator [Pseudobacteriovorax antillogorgiicola]|uniref:Two-component system, chemotaxis family, response regulator CheY n=1 Tax=Pseudobacteriovorax antillogorgiicola TaxID=1513793 RepID=A0A1Y6C8R1_9BACT|nr:response regulator [Pseudobacteriovorax antillogorgiicola]TCS49094.1 two-component system chemotaxis response regulator CheY [Pseudobacteriovorax antillogorgiicola]SMF51788.1 two-component system, chemotaxis family, response regulator CheY [Pseudobacteriovorax antillogorgiicola]